MSITPPSTRVWWNEKLHTIEAMWIAIALVWCLVLFLWMPYWHIYGNQNLSNESYKIRPDAFEAKAKEMVEKYTVRKESSAQIPVVAPPPGSDVYLVARTWDWWPILQLEKDKSYRMHVSSLDVQHGISIQPVNINMQVLPGYDMVFTMTPTQSGDFGLICNEFCGVGHHAMLGKIYVK